ncbi:PREDICTED: zinc finger BED domain-containing protein RICESLEEPER 1-like [Tarenaya hassleriana]|uniref:zinc finger BED domain-containing protein RICESLEEPER 1-like n=1 Tax=Tarenaya hassleriana TaxID=28532 RepID=UPI00053C60A0|nr:PREDICTED: zinc finger BED domain-containing protein RICESLEEPER 1-like [Tarenaya hassleriana]
MIFFVKQDDDNPQQLVAVNEVDRTTNNKRKHESSKRVVPVRSKVWDHFTKLPSNPNKCSCNYCGAELNGSSFSGTSSLKSHIEKSCKVYKKLVESGSQKVLIKDKPEGCGDAKLVAIGFSQDACRKAVVRMIILDELSFAFVEGVGFRHFCSIACPTFVIPSRKIIAKEVYQLFLSEKDALKSLLNDNKQRVSFTTDIWTSITTVSYMVVTAHFIDISWRLNRRIISFRPISNHKGETIARQFEKCLNDWGIDKVFTITVDSASANDSAIRLLKHRLSFVNVNTLVLNGEYLHMRCGAHILNLIVKEGLSDMGDSVIGIRNAIKYVRSSDARLQSFKSREGSGKFTRGSLVLDCTTRWNSTFLMLTSALKYRETFERMEVEDKLYEAYFHEDDESRSSKKRIGPPSESDWDNARRLVHILKVFYDSTLVFSATKKVTSSGCYNEILRVESVLASLIDNSDQNLSTMAKSMKWKYDKYWEGTEKINKLLIIAAVFDPRSKMSFVTHCFEKIYGKDNAKCDEMKKSVTDVLRRLFDSYHTWYKTPSVAESGSEYRSVGNTELYVVPTNDDIDLGIGYEKYDNLFASFSQMMADVGDIEGSLSELDLYLMEKVEVARSNNLNMEFDILTWWKMHSGKFSILAQMARDILAFPVSTVASESVFSTGGRILDQYRSSLTPDMVEALVLSQNWLRSSLISDATRSLKDVIEDNDFIETFERMEVEDKLYEAYFHEDDESRSSKKRIGPPSESDWDNARRVSLMCCGGCLIRIIHGTKHQVWLRVEVNIDHGNTEFYVVPTNDDIDLGIGYEKYDNPFASFSQMMADVGNVEGSLSELDLYLMEKIEVARSNHLNTEFDILMWWKMHSGKFPILAQMARDILAFPVSAVASKSAFSTEGHILDQGIA